MCNTNYLSKTTSSVYESFVFITMPSIIARSRLSVWCTLVECVIQTILERLRVLSMKFVLSHFRLNPSWLAKKSFSLVPSWLARKSFSLVPNHCEGGNICNHISALSLISINAAAALQWKNAKLNCFSVLLFNQPTWDGKNAKYNVTSLSFI